MTPSLSLLVQAEIQQRAGSEESRISFLLFLRVSIKKDGEQSGNLQRIGV